MSGADEEPVIFAEFVTAPVSTVFELLASVIFDDFVVVSCPVAGTVVEAAPLWVSVEPCTPAALPGATFP
jgi:hypothetical protein